MQTQELRIHAHGSGVQQHGSYRGRVRSGCLTCRSRKVKCDEARPVCNNCTRVKRSCVYKARKIQAYRNPGTESRPAEDTSTTPQSLDSSSEATLSHGEASSSLTYPSPSSDEQSFPAFAETRRLSNTSHAPWAVADHPFLTPDSSIVDVTARLERALRHQNDTFHTNDDADSDAASPSALISRDIELTTTMDLLAAREAPPQPSLSFFVEEVDCPWITPFDSVNWQRVKTDIVELSMTNSAVTSAVLAVTALYRGQQHSLPLSKAMSLHHSAKYALEGLLDDETESFTPILVSTFLICIFEAIHYESIPSFKEPGDKFMKRFESWAHHERPHTPLLLRIAAWLRLLHSTTIRGGGLGVMSVGIYDLLTACDAGLPSLSSSNQHLDTSTHLYEVLSTPIFEFYFNLQMISGDLAKLTHYHRSRTTGMDQEEVVEQMSHVKSRLLALWESRSPTQRQTPEDLRSSLAPKIADPIITLIGICTAAYHAEFVEIGRVLGDPVTESTDSKQAMRLIREVVDGDWSAHSEGKLNVGYVRALFLYAIECMDHDENQWAVDRLRRIQNPISRSDFFAAFGKALSDAQLKKERRVTSKYFCIWHFGVPPPFL